MIEQGANVVKPIEGLKYNQNLSRIDFLDRRVYKRGDGIFYPSVTSILSYMPKSRFYETWIKDVGHNADIVLQRAGKEGTQVHEAVERLVNGEEVEWISPKGVANYNLPVWEMILRFADFWETHKPELVSSEEFIFSDKFKYAGTADLVVMLNGERWLLDVKTSNSLHKSHELQLAAYANAFNENKGEGYIQRTGIIWLKSMTRKESKLPGVYQGKGWQIKVVDDIEKNFELFQLIYKLYEMEHPTTEPLYSSYPTSVKLLNLK